MRNPQSWGGIFCFRKEAQWIFSLQGSGILLCARRVETLVIIRSAQTGMPPVFRKILLTLFTLSLILILSTPGRTEQVILSSVSGEYRDSLNLKILNALAGKLDAKLSIINAPFKRRLQFMKTGTIDLMVGLLRRPEREAYIHYVSPPYKNRSDTAFFVKKGAGSLITQYEDLYCLKVGTNIGSKYFHRFDRDTKIDKESVPQETLNFRKLILGRVDAVIQAEPYGIELTHEMGLADQIDIAEYRFKKEKHVYIGISKKSSMMTRLDQIEPIIQKMIKDEEIRALISRHYTDRSLPVPEF